MVEQLEQLGFIFKKVTSADEYILDLQTFKNEHGHCDVPRRYKDNPKLGSWVATTRGAYKVVQAGKKPKNRITQSTINQLNNMGFSWQGIRGRYHWNTQSINFHIANSYIRDLNERKSFPIVTSVAIWQKSIMLWRIVKNRMKSTHHSNIIAWRLRHCKRFFFELVLLGWCFWELLRQSEQTTYLLRPTTL